MSWDDDDFGNEYAKFVRATALDDIGQYDGNVDVLHCEVLYNTLKDYTSQWNKKRKKAEVNPITVHFGTPYDQDIVHYDGGIWLDMGARLFKAVKKAKQENWKYIRIMKISNPNDKFDVQYYVSNYKLLVQSKIDKELPKKTVKKTAKK